MKKLILLLFIPLVIGCSDDESNENNTPINNITPSNLNLEIIIQGISDNFPNGDGTGEVIFNASADNTDYFEYRFGNQETIISETGYLEYTFTDFGTTYQSIYVYAFNENGDSIFTNETITVFVENPNQIFNIELDFSNQFPVGHNTGLNYFNDVTVGVVNFNEDNVKLLLTSGVSSYVLDGGSLNNISSASQVAVPNQGTYYSNYVGLGQLIRDDNGKIYSPFHSEQHTDEFCAGNIPGFYASIGLATSIDNGQSFQLSNSPLIENIYDINYDFEGCDGGLGEPSITFSKDSTEVFLYYVDHNRAGRGVNICMSKFDVNSNHIPNFDNPYYLQDDGLFTNEVIRSREVVTGLGGNSDAIFPQVTYNSYTNTYIMVYSENYWYEFVNQGLEEPSYSGIYVRQSSDGISWDTPPVKLIADWAIPWSSDSHSFSWHPNLIYTNESQSEGYLLYSKADNLQQGHKMWAVKFNIVSN